MGRKRKRHESQPLEKDFLERVGTRKYMLWFATHSKIQYVKCIDDYQSILNLDALWQQSTSQAGVCDGYLACLVIDLHPLIYEYLFHSCVMQFCTYPRVLEIFQDKDVLAILFFHQTLYKLWLDAKFVARKFKRLTVLASDFQFLSSVLQRLDRI